MIDYSNILIIRKILINQEHSEVKGVSFENKIIITYKKSPRLESQGLGIMYSPILPLKNKISIEDLIFVRFVRKTVRINV